MTTEASQIERLLEIMATLRSPEGCPWDREQDLNTLRPYLIEEAYEVLDAIESGDRDKHREELGDLLLQVVFQAQIRKDDGDFDFQDVAKAISDKLVRRHPHVFGTIEVSDAAEVVQNWDDIKRQERGEKGEDRSVLSGVPRQLPALMKAHEVQKRAARIGFDWDDPSEPFAKIEEELQEVRHELASGNTEKLHEEIGDLLFSVVNFTRHLKVPAEDLLQHATYKFSARFRALEKLAHERGVDLKAAGLEELDRLWDEIKQSGEAPS